MNVFIFYRFQLLAEFDYMELVSDVKMIIN